MTEQHLGSGERLRDVFARGHAAHAYIVAGEKRQLPDLLKQCAKVCMCATHSGKDDCEICKKVQQNLHQDVLRFPTELTRARLNVADMQTLVEESFKRPIDQTDCRVFLINAADSVTGIGAEIWQNKLLKTLEEPADNAYIFIGVTDAESLLPTIRSRCQILKQPQLSEKEVFAALLEKGYQASWAEVAASVGCGSVQSAEAALANPAVMRSFEVALDVLQNMTSTKNALPYVSAILSERESVPHVFNFMSLLLRESIVFRLAQDLCLFGTRAKEVEQICANYSLQAAEVCIEKINYAKKRLDDGGNVTVVIDQLVSSVLEVKYRCRI